MHQRAPVHVLVLPVLRQQPDESVLLRTCQPAVQEDFHADPAWGSAYDLRGMGDCGMKVMFSVVRNEAGRVQWRFDGIFWDSCEKLWIWGLKQFGWFLMASLPTMKMLCVLVCQVL